MIIIFPLMPVIIAILVLAFALLSATADAMNGIVTVAWVVIIITTVTLIICNIFRKTSIKNRIIGTSLSVVATAITVTISKRFLSGLLEADSMSIMGMFEFGFVLVFGGCLWLACVGMCCYAAFVCVDSDEYDDTRYGIAVSLIVGSLLLGSVFGLL